jgi:hypothetical protein
MLTCAVQDIAQYIKKEVQLPIRLQLMLYTYDLSSSTAARVQHGTALWAGTLEALSRMVRRHCLSLITQVT